MVLTHSHSVMAARARSSRWGETFLPSSDAANTAIIYDICRIDDDLVGENDPLARARDDISLLTHPLEGAASPRSLTDVAHSPLARGVHKRALHEHLFDLPGDHPPNDATFGTHH